MLAHSQLASLLKVTPFPSLLLHAGTGYPVAGVNQAYLSTMGLAEEQVVGKGVFESYSGNIWTSDTYRKRALNASLERVLKTGESEQMDWLELHIVAQKSSTVNPRYWVPVCYPLLNEEGEFDHILLSAVEIKKPGESTSNVLAGKSRNGVPDVSGRVRETDREHGMDDVLRMLKERIKEQACLYKISSLNEQELTLDELLDKAAAVLPEGWQHPEVTAAAIEFAGKTYTTPNFTETPWTMSAEAGIREGRLLTIKVVYLDEMPVCDEGPFLVEERKLVNSIIRHLALKVDRILSQKELEEKQKLLDKTYQLARIGSWEFDMQTHELHWSPVTKEVHGFGPDYEPDVESTIALFKEGYDRETFARAAQNAIENNQPFDVELRIISGKGDERWIRATGEPEFKDGVCIRFYGISQNVSDRRQAEEDLQLREQRFKALVQDGADLIAILDERGNFTYVSPTSETVLGIPADNFIGTNALDYIHEDDKDVIADSLFSLPSSKRIHIPPYRFLDAMGNWRWVETILTNMTDDPAVGGMVANSRDVTRQKEQQEQNQEALKEKETLLAEIHHRVKNNLAVVSGMIQLQAFEEENKDTQRKLLDSVVRIQTMANIHEQLYQSSSFSKLKFADNIQSLALNIQKTFQSQTDVSIEFQCDPVQLNINQAIPCSLIVNEVITNIFKHAFPQQGEGQVTVRLAECSETNRLRLCIKDNGVGFPKGFDGSSSSSLGFSLINVLSHQLKADYRYDSVAGETVFTIEFEKDEQKGIGNHFLV